MSDTRARLLAAAADVVREQGAWEASARVIAARAEVNQALVFYHFGSVAALVDAACRAAVDEAIDGYREQLTQVTSLPGLLDVGRSVREQERTSGNVAMMAQLMAGARTDPVLADAARYATDAWVATFEPVVHRVLAGSALAVAVDPAGLARAISAAFIGLELYDGVDPEGATAALAVLDGVAEMVAVLDGLGPVARRALRAGAGRLSRRCASRTRPCSTSTTTATRSSPVGMRGTRPGARP